MRFSRQEYWSGLPFPSPRSLPNPVIKPLDPASSPALQAESLPLSCREVGSSLTCFGSWFLLKSLSSIQFSHSVVSHSLRPHESQHARPSCPSPTPGVYPNPCPPSLWCHPAISSSVIPFSCSQSLPVSESFPMSQLFTWGGQIIGVSASESVLPMNTQEWFPLNGLIGSPWSPRNPRVFSKMTVQKHQFFGTHLSLYSNSHIHTWPLEKP